MKSNGQTDAWSGVLPSLVPPCPRPPRDLTSKSAAMGMQKGQFTLPPVVNVDDGASRPRAQSVAVDLPNTSLSTEAVENTLSRSQRSNRFHNCKARLQESHGCNLTALKVGDVTANRYLHSELSRLQLNDYFDDKGSPRCHRLGLAFVANLKAEVGGPIPWGSKTKDLPAARDHVGQQSAKAFIKAEEAKERDLTSSKQRTTEITKNLEDTDRLRAEDVKYRQVEVIFNEMPHFERYLPRGVTMAELMREESDKDQEMHDRHFFDRANALLYDRHFVLGSSMNWLFTQSEIHSILRLSSLWTRATRPLLGTSLMDRPTFCRFVLDVGLIDTERAPLHWATSLFDSVARPLHCSMSDFAPTYLVPVSPVVCSWHIVCIFDALLRARFLSQPTAQDDMKSVSPMPRRPATSGTSLPTAFKSRFILKILSIAKARLPQYILDESGVTHDEIKEILAKGEGNVDMGDVGSGESVQHSSPHQTATSNISDDHRRESVRSQLVYSFMVEPEVLHLVAQFYELFMRLHKCYAEKSPSLSYAALLQFCVDFSLTPNLVNTHTLQELYQSAQCLECATDGAFAEPVSTSVSSMPLPPSAAAAPPPTPVRLALPGAPSPAKRTGRPGAEMGGSARHQTSTNSVSSRSISPTAARLAGLAGTSPRRRKMSTTSVSSSSEPGSPTGSSVAISQIVTATQTARRQRKAAIGIFGVGAFIETLCRIAFTHLESYGNSQQNSVGGFSRMVWLLAYLRHVFDGLRESLAKKDSAVSEGAHVAVLHDALRNSLDVVTAMCWSPTALPPAAWLKQRTTIRPELPVVEVPSSDKPRRAQQQSQQASNSSSPPRSRSKVLRRVATKALALARLKLATNSLGTSKEGVSVDGLQEESLASPRSTSKTSDMKLLSVAHDDGKASGVPSGRKKSSSTDSSSDDDSSRIAVPVRKPSLEQLSKGVRTPRSSCGFGKASKTHTSNVAFHGEAKQNVSIGDVCVEDGECRRCRRTLDENLCGWGLATCCGCSVVDCIDFDRHPFHVLLQEPSRKSENFAKPIIGDGPFIPQRVALTPPIVNNSNVLRPSGLFTSS
eukprot:TRINITY_DN75446_c0_g1_i1.p1 TRINITY_DN75446_c0_g1~~TRINITY_DN75446_c0_g1_i1.p1  ORF type:complete len:1069 (+),score=121.38 TRINITY_DN75446_c0_g1_i1:139-3345(+)